MRILIYVPTITFDGLAGNSVHVRELAQNLLQLGNEVVVIGNLSDRAYNGPVTVRPTRLPRMRVLGRLITQIQALFLFISETVKSKHELAYTRFGLASGPCLLMARLTRVPCVVEVNGFPRDEAQVSRVGPWGRMNSCLTVWVSETACRHAQQVIAVTPLIKEVLVSTLGIRPEKIVVIPNGANTSLFRAMDADQARRQLNLTGADYFVTFVGMLAAWQGVEYLIESIPQVLERCPGGKFLIVGDGPMKQRLIELAQRTGVSESMIFAGRVPYDKVPLYMNAGDVCVAPFIKERNERSGLSPLKIYEYAACGKAMVTSRLPGLEFVAQSKLGILVEPDDSEELAKAIIGLIRDREHRERMGRDGREYVVHNHSWESVARKVAQVCKRAIQEHKANRRGRGL